MTRNGLWSKTPALMALVALAAAPVTADWLITSDGNRVETKGPWKVDGRRVLFTQPNGTLSAMRASEIDLEASEKATMAAIARAAEATHEAPEPKPLPEPVLVLTNKDIGPSTEPDPDAPARPEVLPSIADREPVQVITWKRYDVEDGVELRGTVRNTGASVAANIRVRATVNDEDGAEIATGNAFLGNSSLVSGRSTTFRIVLPEVDDFDGAPTFLVTSTEITIGGAARSRSADSAGDQDSEGETASQAETTSAGEEAVEGDDDAKP